VSNEPQQDCFIRRRNCDCNDSEKPFQKKYSTRNPIWRLVVRNFSRKLQEILDMTEGRILDVGAGEGDAYTFLSPEIIRRGTVAVEPNTAYFERMAKIAPAVEQIEGSIYRLPFEDNSFDTVMCSEVLEHLTEPDKGLQELLRVCRRWLVLSVPREPIWRILNMARCAYLKDFGNTPDHRQHWSKKGFIRWVGRYADVTHVRSPLPWTIILATPRTPH
jgi:ubiquinone/menaquinone biosynthesis C-methylase UbiE